MPLAPNVPVHAKQPKTGDYSSYLAGHQKPALNKTIQYFRGDIKGREDATLVLDHALKLKREQEKKKKEEQDKETIQDQQNSMAKARIRQEEAQDVTSVTSGPQMDDNEIACIRQIELLTDVNLDLKEIKGVDLDHCRRFVHTPKDGYQPPED